MIELFFNTFNDAAQKSLFFSKEKRGQGSFMMPRIEVHWKMIFNVQLCVTNVIVEFLSDASKIIEDKREPIHVVGTFPDKSLGWFFRQHLIKVGGHFLRWLCFMICNWLLWHEPCYQVLKIGSFWHFIFDLFRHVSSQFWYKFT